MPNLFLFPCYNIIVKKIQKECKKMDNIKVLNEIPEDMVIIDGMPASKPQSADGSRKPWEG